MPGLNILWNAQKQFTISYPGGKWATRCFPWLKHQYSSSGYIIRIRNHCGHTGPLFPGSSIINHNPSFKSRLLPVWLVKVANSWQTDSCTLKGNHSHRHGVTPAAVQKFRLVGLVWACLCELSHRHTGSHGRVCLNSQYQIDICDLT